MADFSVDWGELNELVADLTKTANATQAEVAKSLKQSAFHTRDAWRKHAREHVAASVADQYAPTIDFDESSSGEVGGAGELEVVIGPNIDRYGGKTGKGGLIPSMGILDDPNSGIKGQPSRSRWEALRFAEKDLPERMQKAVDETLRKAGL